MRPADRALRLRHAVALGLVQGPAELLPVSSSAHTALLPYLAGWRVGDLDARARKSLALALHGGAGVALALQMRRELREAASRLDGARAALLALSLAPPALAGVLLRGSIEQRLDGPLAAAAGLAVGGAAMALADARGPRAALGRRCADAGAADGLALGVAQALALAPGVSRNGAALTAARARGFSRPAAQSLSWAVALPVILGASLAELPRLARPGGGPGSGAAFAAGALASFASTSLSARALRREGYRGRSLLPYSVYRCLLAGAVARRAWRLRAAR
jgi:undecaprenyl-diphosphatase